MTRTKGPFRDASPAQLRAALLPEHLDDFDRGYRDALAVAARDLTLERLTDFLESWRRVAWVAADKGEHAYRAMLADAAHRLATGTEPAGGYTEEQMRADLEARLARVDRAAG